MGHLYEEGDSDSPYPGVDKEGIPHTVCHGVCIVCGGGRDDRERLWGGGEG